MLGSVFETALRDPESGEMRVACFRVAECLNALQDVAAALTAALRAK